MGLEGYGLAVGCNADLVVLQARDPIEAIRLKATRLTVIRRGRVIAESPSRRSTLKLDGRPAAVEPWRYAPPLGGAATRAAPLTGRAHTGRAADTELDRPGRSAMLVQPHRRARRIERTMTTLRAGSVQFQHRANDKAYNLGRMGEFVTEAAAAGVQILAFPEMCITGYWHVRNLGQAEIAALAEPVPGGPSTAALAELAVRNGMVIGAGLLERGEDGRFFNTYVVCLPDGAIHRHRKLHAFESEHIASGDSYTVFDTPFGVRVGVLICWDNNLVENVRATALLGADILLAPHQTGGCASRSPHAMGVIDPALWQRRASTRRRSRPSSAATRAAAG